MNGETFRLHYGECRQVLQARLTEPAPARIMLLTGPRQVGKTTLLLELAERFKAHAVYAAADGPEAALPGFWERLWSAAEQKAAAAGKSIVFLDEAHLLPDWSRRLKGEWDRLRRKRLPVHVVATGSSALMLGSGSRESLAGRFERLVLSHWTAASLVDVFGLTEHDAAELVVRMGSYPGAMDLRNDIVRWAAYIRDAILEPAIGRDILALAAVRKPALLRQVFGVCAASPARIVSLQKIQGQLQDAGAIETIEHYLRLLEEAYLAAPLRKFSTSAARRRAAPPKLMVLSNAFLAVTDPAGIPMPAADPSRFGQWLENACLAHAWNRGQTVTYWREEPLEVDGILEGSWGNWAVEVKTGSATVADLRGLLEFTRRHPRFRPLLISDEAADVAAERAGIASVSWQDYLLVGPPQARS